MRICFVVADVKDQQPTYAGIYLALAAHRRGHDVRFASVENLSFLDDNNVLATTTRVRHGDYKTPADYAHALASDDAVNEEDTLSTFDVVLLRYNPVRESPGRPSAPLIDFGWRLRLAGTLVVNDPEGLRRAGSRMYLADFPADVRTKTLVSRSKKRLKEFLRGLDGPAVLKPLSPRGGENVFYLTAAPGLEPESDHHRRHQGRLRHRAGIPARDRAGRKAAAAAQRRAYPRRQQACRDLSTPPAGRQERRPAAREPRDGQPLRARPRRGPHLRHPAPQAARRRPLLRRRRHCRRQDPRAQRLHPRRHPLDPRALRRRRRRHHHPGPGASRASAGRVSNHVRSGSRRGVTIRVARNRCLRD